jgi:hypothetical protein
LGWRLVGTPTKVSTDGSGLVAINIATAAAANDVAELRLGTDATAMLSAGVAFVYHGIIKTAINISDAKIKVGLLSGTADADKAADSNSIVFFYDSAAANWKAVTRLGGVETETDTGVAVGVSTDYRFKIIRRIVADGGISDVRFYINESLVATHTTNIPIGSQNPAFAIEAKVATAKNMDVKFFAIYQHA